MLLRQKSGVRLDLDERMAPALAAVDVAWSRIGREPTATAGRDGEHSCRSKHYYGLAIDLRTNDLAESEKRSVYNELTAVLKPKGFDVVLESDHIHIEYDPKVPT